MPQDYNNIFGMAFSQTMLVYFVYYVTILYECDMASNDMMPENNHSPIFSKHIPFYQPVCAGVYILFFYLYFGEKNFSLSSSSHIIYPLRRNGKDMSTTLYISRIKVIKWLKVRDVCKLRMQSV